MGYLSAVSMAEQTDLTTALTWHLRGNHYPPVSLDFLPAVKRAIQYAKRGKYNVKVRCPYKQNIPVLDLVRGLHLDAFI